MSIQSDGSACVRASWGDISRPEFTTTFILRVDEIVPGQFWQYPFQSDNVWFVYVLAAAADRFDVRGSIADSNGHQWEEQAVTGLPVGIPLQVTLSYSAADPSRRFVQVNEYRTVGWSGLSGDARIPGNWQVGGDDRAPTKATIESVLFIERALADAEIDAFRADPAATAAALSGAPKYFYSFAGPVGADVATGDAGISIAGDAERSFAVVPAAGSTLRYAERLVVRKPTVARAAVGTSGAVLAIACTNPDGTPAVSTPDQAAAMTPPSIRVNGGDPIPLEPASSGRTCHHPDRGVYFWLFPDGLAPVSPTDVVTLDAPVNWLSTAVGGVDGMDGFAADNRAGRPFLEPSDGRMRLGIDTTTFMSSVWSWGRWNANPAKMVEWSGPRWEDGNLVSPFGALCFWHPGSNGVDPFGYDPSPWYGLWALVWDDYDPGAPFTEMSLAGFTETALATEVPGYASDVGGRHVRVYDVRPNIWNMTLAAGVDAAATTIPAAADPSPLWQGWPGPGVAVLIEIGEEKIRAGGYDPGTHTWTGCVRGYGGTTAAPHAAGAAFTAQNTDPSFGLAVSSTHDASRRYKNLRLYSPDNWSRPEAVGPVAFGDEDHYQFDSFFKEQFLDHGLGSIRPMETSGAMDDVISEIEDVPAAEYPLWNYSIKELRWAFKEILPFDPAGKYFYFHYQLPQFETYAATLEADCGAEDDVVAVSHEAADPRFVAGQILFVGEEKIRIVAPPKDGSNLHRVARGQFGTTPAAHAAGAITAGWRIAVTDAEQYDVTSADDKYHYHYGELVLDEAASAAPMRCGIAVGGSRSNNHVDVNVAARRSFTLAAALPASATSMTVAAAPGDWDWIKPGGYLLLGGERMTIKAADPATGVVEVFARSGGAADLPSGAAGTTSAPGPLCSTEDGSTQYYLGLFGGGPMLIPTGPDRGLWRMRASDDLGPRGLSMRVVEAQALDPSGAVKPDPADPLTCRGPWNFHPHGFIARACAEGKAHAWITIPYSASDAYAYEVAKIYRDLLPAGCKIYVELGNEVWNYWINALLLSAYGYSWATKLGDNNYHHVQRSYRVGEVVRACWGEVGREADVVPTIAWQFGALHWIYEAMTALEGLGYEPPRLGAIADAPYTVRTSTAEFIATFDAADDEQAIDLCAHDDEFGDAMYGPYASGVAVLDAIEARYGYRPERCFYEGGDGNVAPVDPIDDGDYLARREAHALRTLDLVQHPNWRHHQRGQWAAYERRCEATTATLFCYSRPGVYSSDYAFAYLWGLMWHSRHRPGLGDGGDGLADNRLHLYQRGKPNSTDFALDSPGRHNVAVRAKAFTEYNDEYFAAPTPSYILESDGVTLVLTFAEPVTWTGDGVLQVLIDGVPSVGHSDPTGSGTATLTFTLDTPIPGGVAVSLIADPEVVVTVADGTPVGGQLVGAAVDNQSVWTPGGGDGGDGGGPRRRGGAAMLLNRL